MLVLERAHVDLGPLPELAPQPLGDPATVVRDHGVRRREDRLRRAVVLLQLDDPGVGEVVLEVEDVAHLGPAERIDRSEERRVGKECRSRWSPYDEKKN